MRNRTITRILCCIVVLFFYWTPRSLALEDTIVAIVNDAVITLKDLRQFLAAKQMQLKAAKKTPEEIEKILSEYANRGLNKLIDEKLFIDQADKKGIEINEKILEQRVEQIRKEYPNEQIFFEALKRDGITLTDLKNRIKDQLKVQSIIDLEVRSKIFVSPREITDYYQQHARLFKKPEQVDLKSIFISFKDGKEKAQEKVKAAIRTLKETGNDFLLVASDYSELPSVGLVSRGQLKPSIEEIVFNLKPKEISDPIETNEGIYIFMLNERYPERMFSLDEVKEKTRRRLFQKKFSARLKEWIEEIKRKAYVEIKK